MIFIYIIKIICIFIELPTTPISPNKLRNIYICIFIYGYCISFNDRFLIGSYIKLNTK